MIAIILAGGKSSRMRGGTEKEEREKALITVGSSGNQIRLLDIVVEAVRASNVDNFFIAVTRNTPETADYCKRADYKTVETPGKGYHEDLWFLLARYPAFVSIACDIPFLRSTHINAILDAYRVHRASITGAIPLDLLPDGITPSHTFEYEGKTFVSCGINVVTNAKDSIPFIFDDSLLAINVNTSADLSLARSMRE
ncbi:MAG: NTP transferase domain-containing protein [Methanomicrobia archaeon]|nr:NTP transferase domain-containing protein [Methanomicrobia archaeon]